MILRCFALALSVLVLAGCANDGVPGVSAGFATASLPGASGSGAAANVGAGDPLADGVPRKTLASRVLAAIALERVTGRKADPARLTETR